jgi:hypothetical protein
VRKEALTRGVVGAILVIYLAAVEKNNLPTKKNIYKWQNYKFFA